MKTRRLRLIIALAVIVAMTASTVAKADEVYSGGVSVDINRDVNGYLWIEDATVNLLENAHIKNARYYGDIYAVSGCVLNIYGGVIDGYLYVTTSYNDLPEAQVTIYGSQFAVNGVPVAEGTTEVFLQNQRLSGVYQNGTPFSHWVDCFIEGNFYLTVKLGWIISKPKMAVTPQSLNFGQVKVGCTATQTVTVFNEGNANLSLQTVFFVQDSNPDFSHTPLEQLPFTIEPGDAADVTVIFAPTAEGQALGVLKLTGDDADTPFIDVVTTGTGIVPDIAIEPAAIDFGQLVVGNSSTGTVLITNNGQADLIISDITWAAGGSADFAVAALPALPLTLAPAASAQLEIKNTPTAAGSAAATLAITSDDPDQPIVNLAVTGQATSPEVTPVDQIKALITFYEESVRNGSIQGVGKDKCAKMHLAEVKEVLKMTEFLLLYERNRCAAGTLKVLIKFTDGNPKPKDIITGSAVPELNTRILALLESVKEKVKNKCK